MFAIQVPTVMRWVAAPMSWAVASTSLLTSAAKIASNPASSASRATACTSLALQPTPGMTASASRSAMVASSDVEPHGCAPSGMRSENTRRPAGRLAAGGLGAPEGQHGRARPGHEPLLRVHDVALDEADRPAALHDASGGGEPSRPDGLEEVDLELERRERLALVERGRPGHPHRRVRDVAEDAAVERAHRVRVALRRLERDDRPARLDGDERESDERGDGRRRQLSALHHADRVEHPGHRSLLTVSAAGEWRRSSRG